MTRARNLPIDVAQGTSKDVTVVFEDKPDLTAAQCLMLVKRHATDSTYVFCKPIDLAKSTKLAQGEVVWSFAPSESTNLDPRTYTYEVKVIIGDAVYVPLIGDFNVFSAY